MRRKLIKQGAGGYTISLPIKWVRDHGLEPGEEIDLVEEGNALKVLSTHPNLSIKSTTLVVEKASFKFYRSMIGGLYRAGYDEIRVEFKDSSVLLELQKTIDLLPGYELLDIMKHSCLVKNTSGQQVVDLHTHFLKIVHSINTMFTIIEGNLKSKKSDSDQQLSLLRNNVLKNRDLIIRTIGEQRLTDEKHLPYYTLVSYSWMIARSLYYLSKSVTFSTPTFLRLFNEIREYFHTVFSMPNHSDAFKIREGYDLVFKKVEEHLRNGSSPALAAYLVGICMGIESCNSALLVLKKDTHLD